jgi:hypothetical protein
VSGRILRPDGTPLANREVPLEMWFSGVQEWASTKTDEDGHFQLTFSKVGPVNIRVRLAGVGLNITELRLKEGQDIENLEIRLHPFLIVQGVVLDEETKKPIGGATVRSRHGYERQDPPEPANRVTSNATAPRSPWIQASRFPRW